LDLHVSLNSDGGIPTGTSRSLHDQSRQDDEPRSETHQRPHKSSYEQNRTYNEAVIALIPLKGYEDATLARKSKFSPHKPGSTARDRLRIYHSTCRCSGRRLDVVEHVVAVPCSCVVVQQVLPPLAVRPRAPDAAPPRCPTRTGKKRCASGLLGPRGAKARAWRATAAAKRRGSGQAAPLPSTYIGVPNVLPSWRPISNPKPCLIRVQPELGFQPLKRATLWVHVHIDMGRVLLLAQ